ncbi:hypothetical protein ADICEAN_03592 [Cesiribacter andamanensis AMV16]|uniref:Uncharacterized protein n=1 Tax=Cesiribacter andamanensis AMV16 TaxID=1279009 RepID=M7MXY9_9BACT|nr:hypothetical protein ADICEAN_03592 [Cesiribacter andamanensis AMV16]
MDFGKNGEKQWLSAAGYRNFLPKQNVLFIVEIALKLFQFFQLSYY